MRVALLTAALCISPVTAQPTGNVYVPKDGGFTVHFPGKPKEVVQPAKSPIGEMKLHTATYATADGSVYLVSFTEFPATAVKAEGHHTLLDGVRDGLKGKDGKLVTEKDVAFGSDTGREVVIDKGKQQTRFRAVVKGNRLYQVAAVGAGTFVTGAEATAFLDSFQLTK